MQLTVLGTANAWGPNPFLNPPPPLPMVGALPNGTPIEIRRYRTSLLIETSDGKKILVDCSPDFSNQLRQFQFGVVDAILLTHPHLDHIGGLDELNLYRPTGQFPIDTYATSACWNCIKTDRGFGYVIDPLHLVTEIQLFPHGGPREFAVGSVTITPFRVEHHFIAPGAVGYAFEETVNGQTKRILYTGDLWAISNPVDPLFGNRYDLVVIECDRWSGLAGPGVGGGHMSFTEAVRMLTNGVFSNPRPNQVMFVHFGDNGPVGTGSTYDDWRRESLNQLAQHGLQGVMPDQDKVIAYEGLTCAV